MKSCQIIHSIVFRNLCPDVVLAYDEAFTGPDFGEPGNMPIYFLETLAYILREQN